MDDTDAFVASLERRIATLTESFGVGGIPSQENVVGTGGEQVLRHMVALRRQQGQLLARSGDLDGAWTCLQEALGLVPGDSLLLADLSEMAEQLGPFPGFTENRESMLRVVRDRV